MLYSIRITEYDLDRILSDYIPGLYVNPEAFERYEPDVDVFDQSAASWEHMYILGTEYTDVMVWRTWLEAKEAPHGVYAATWDGRWAIGTNLNVESLTEQYSRF
jgi:hypothetical protein